MKTCQSIFRPLAFVIATLLVTACGQKGPWYLPDPASEQAKQYEPGQEDKKKQEKEDN
jgi:predicted small lipoprotein YifL